MTVELTRQWTCDNCGYTESHPATDPSPRHWVGVMYNQTAPIGSMDHAGWSHDILCGNCWSIIVDMLDNEAPDDANPKDSDASGPAAKGGS